MTRTKSVLEQFPLGCTVRVLPTGVHAIVRDDCTPSAYEMGIVGLKGKVISRDNLFVQVLFPKYPQVQIARHGLDLLFEPHELEVLEEK